MYRGWAEENSVEEVDEFFLHVFVDVAVTGEGFATFFVNAEGADEIGVLDFLVEIADEGASGEVAAGDFIQWVFLFSTCRRIENSDHSVHSASREYLFDGHVVFLRPDEGKEFFRSSHRVRCISLPEPLPLR